MKITKVENEERRNLEEDIFRKKKTHTKKHKNLDIVLPILGLGLLLL